MEEYTRRGTGANKGYGVSYELGVDLGTTYTAAALRRAGRAEIASLGNRAAAIPSVLFLRPDGELLVGDAAGRRGLSEPSRNGGTGVSRTMVICGV